MKYYASRLLPLYISIAVVVGVLIGRFYANQYSGNRISFINTSQDKISNLLDAINERYVDKVDMNEIVEKSIPQILKELDPHSTYVSAKDVEASMQELKGSFSGIGVQYMIYEDTVRVVRIIEGGPAEEAGLRAGDRIVTIDNKPFVGKSVNNDAVMKNLKGERGSSVRLGVKRNGIRNLVNISITRGDVEVKSIDASYMLDEKTGYIRITSWGNNTYAEFLRAMATLSPKGMENLVIDLRGNLGGYLQAAVEVANEFLPKNSMIVYDEGRNFKKEEYKSDGKGSYQQMPLVVLIDETSASASEIFAGAMQDNDRATLVGRRSFGKGLVQVPLEFRDGSMLRLTVARYYTPSGRCVQKPFKPGDEEDYENDLLQRAATGEYFSSDSIKTSGEVYKTRLGRKVYGGGGIIPDYFIPRDTIGFTSYYKEVYMSGTINQFAFWYVDNHRQELSRYSEALQLAKYLRGQKIVEAFANYADKHGMKRRNLMIKTSHSLLENSIISNIISDRLGIGSAVIYLNNNDPFVAKALNILNKGLAFPSAANKSKTASITLPNYLLWKHPTYDFQKRFAILSIRRSQAYQPRKA
jgi:peptidase, S41 family